MEQEPRGFPVFARGAAHSRHRVLISGDPAQWRRTVRAFFQEGLVLGEPCLCLYYLISRQSVCRCLEAVGVDAEAVQNKGLLTFLSAEEVFNQDGVFSPTTCLGTLVKAGRSAVPNWGGAGQGGGGHELGGGQPPETTSGCWFTRTSSTAACSPISR